MVVNWFTLGTGINKPSSRDTNIKIAQTQNNNKGDELRDLFHKWEQEDSAKEHHETFEYLAEALDIDRQSLRQRM